MDHGIVGGSLKTRRRRSRRSGSWRCAFFAAKLPTASRSSRRDLNVEQVDWRQLQRWGISEARVPAGAVVRFREPSVWDRYQATSWQSRSSWWRETALIVGTARPAAAPPAGRGAVARQRGPAANELRAHSRSRRAAADRAGNRARADCARAARRHQPAGGAPRDRPRAAAAPAVPHVKDLSAAALHRVRSPSLAACTTCRTVCIRRKLAADRPRRRARGPRAGARPGRTSISRSRTRTFRRRCRLTSRCACIASFRRRCRTRVKYSGARHVAVSICGAARTGSR